MSTIINVEIMDSEDGVVLSEEIDWDDKEERKKFQKKADKAISEGGWYMVKPS